MVIFSVWIVVFRKISTFAEPQFPSLRHRNTDAYPHRRQGACDHELEASAILCLRQRPHIPVPISFVFVFSLLGHQGPIIDLCL